MQPTVGTPTQVLSSNDNETVYHPLDYGKKQIRLLRMSQSDDIHIHFELATFSLNDSPAYVALSYCWTQAKPTCEVRLNGQIFHVRPNLYGYLELMQRERYSGWIFIDALCINQKNLEERSCQVKLMGDIFKQAESVEVWLGLEPCEPLSLEASRLMQSLVDDDTALASVSNRTLGKDMIDYLKGAFNSTFLEQEYWSRAWTVQEVLLARAVRFRCGIMQIDEHRLARWSETLIRDTTSIWKDTRSLDEVIFSAISSTIKQGRSSAVIHRMLLAHFILQYRQEAFRQMSTRQSDQWSIPPMSYIDALLLFGQQQCTERYDKAYALLGLTNMDYFRVDYTMPKMEFYLQSLVLGFLNILRDPPITTSIQSFSPKYKPLRFYIALLRSLQLSPAQPAVALMTQVTFELLGAPSTPRQLFECFWFEKMITLRTNLGDSLFGKLLRLLPQRALAQALTMATQFQLICFEAIRGLRLPACDESGRRTYESWTNTTVSLLQELVQHVS